MCLSFSSPIGLKEELGRTDAEIDRRAIQVRKNCSMRTIIWRADDPDMHSFVVRKKGATSEEGKEEEGETHTVASYYRTKYGIQLRYPHLPIVNIGKKNYFPLEFLYRAGGKTKGENSNERVQSVLGYYDANAGYNCIRNVSELSKLACDELQNKHGVSFNSVLANFHLKRSPEPEELRAKVLTEPRVSFKANDARLNNGSWNLRDAEFKTYVSLFIVYLVTRKQLSTNIIVFCCCFVCFINFFLKHLCTVLLSYSPLRL